MIDWKDREPSQRLWSSIEDLPEDGRQQRLLFAYDMASNTLKDKEWLLLQANRRLRLTIPLEEKVQKLQEDISKVKAEKTMLDRVCYENQISLQNALDDLATQGEDFERSRDEMSEEIEALKEAKEKGEPTPKPDDYTDYLQSTLEASQSQLEENEKTIDNLRTELAFQAAKAQRLEQSHQEVMDKADAHTDLVQSLKEEIVDHKTQLHSSRADESVLKERLANSQRIIEELHAEVAEVKKKLSGCTESIKTYREENRDLVAKISRMDQEIETMLGELNTRHQLIGNLEKTESLLGERVFELTRMNESLEAAQLSKDEVIDRLKDEAERYESMLGELRQRLADTSTIDDLKNEQEEFSTRVDELVRELAWEREQVKMLHAQLEAVNRRKKELELEREWEQAKLLRDQNEAADRHNQELERERAQVKLLRDQLAALDQHIQELRGSRKVTLDEMASLRDVIWSLKRPLDSILGQLVEAENELHAMDDRPKTEELELEVSRQVAVGFEQEKGAALGTLSDIRTTLDRVSIVYKERMRELRGLRDRLKYLDESSAIPQGTSKISPGCNSEICFCTLMLWMWPDIRLTRPPFGQDFCSCSQHAARRTIQSSELAVSIATHKPELDAADPLIKDEQQTTASKQQGDSASLSGVFGNLDKDEDRPCYCPSDTCRLHAPTLTHRQPLRTLGHGHGGPPFQGVGQFVCRILTALLWLSLLILTQPYNVLQVYLFGAGILWHAARLATYYVRRLSGGGAATTTMRTRRPALLEAPSASTMVGAAASLATVFVALLFFAVEYERRIWLGDNDWRTAYLRDVLGQKPYPGWSPVEVDFRLLTVDWLDKGLNRLLFPERYSKLW